MSESDVESIGKYKILGVLGKGAMGLVYRAEDTLLKRHVALKVITGDDIDDEMKVRFQIEARAAAALDHPNIVVVYDLGDERGTPYIAMELLKGEDLRQLMRRRPEMPIEEAAGIIIQACDGLAYAHERRIVHRDIKPANIHICPGNRVKIVDFGVAKMDSTSLTKTGMVIGTPDYMSPEQIQGKQVDTRSDIFSVGVVFYELLTRNKPFRAESITSVIYNIVFKTPTSFAELSLDVPAEIERIVGRAMGKDLSDRYQSIADMATDLRRFLAHEAPLRGPASQPAFDSEATKVLTGGELAAARGPAPATGTLQVGEDPSARRRADEVSPTLVSTSAGGATVVRPRTGEPSRRGRGPVVAAIVAAACVALVASVLVLRHRRAAVVAGAPLGVEMVITPWARIEKLERLDGGGTPGPIVLEQAVTPVRLMLPPGRYRASLVNSELALSESLEFDVHGPGSQVVTHVLAGFDPARAVASFLATP